jgi:hypothetical protein
MEELLESQTKTSNVVEIILKLGPTAEATTFEGTHHQAWCFADLEGNLFDCQLPDLSPLSQSRPKGHRLRLFRLWRKKKSQVSVMNLSQVMLMRFQGFNPSRLRAGLAGAQRRATPGAQSDFEGCCQKGYLPTTLKATIQKTATMPGTAGQGEESPGEGVVGLVVLQAEGAIAQSPGQAAGQEVAYPWGRGRPIEPVDQVVEGGGSQGSLRASRHSRQGLIIGQR